MKKYLLIATVALGLTACSGGQKAENAQTTNDTIPAVTTAPAAASTDSTATASTDSVLVQYESLINQAIDLQGKVSKGDAAAQQNLIKVMDQMKTVVTSLQNAAANLTPAQTQKLAELGQKWAAAAPKANQ